MSGQSTSAPNTVTEAAPDMMDALYLLGVLLDFDKQVEPGENITFKDPSAINKAFAQAKAALNRAWGTEGLDTSFTSRR